MRSIFLSLILSLLLTACASPRAHLPIKKINNELIRAYFYEKNGQVASAEQTYEHLIELAPHAGAVRNNYGAFLCRIGRYREGIYQLLLAAHEAHYDKKNMAFQNARQCKKESLLR